MGGIFRQNGLYSGLYCDRGGLGVGDLNLALSRWRENGTCCSGCGESDGEISSGPDLLSVGSIQATLDGHGVDRLLPWLHLGGVAMRCYGGGVAPWVVHTRLSF